jgi:hypothetical protein
VTDSIRPVREPTERSYEEYVCEHSGLRACEATSRVAHERDEARAEVERLQAERRELREALAFYDPHAPAAIEHEFGNA